MPLVTTKEMFKKAYEGGYAIGAFNVNNMEIVQGIADAAIELNSPIILQVSAHFSPGIHLKGSYRYPQAQESTQSTTI